MKHSDSRIRIVTFILTCMLLVAISLKLLIKQNTTPAKQAIVTAEQTTDMQSHDIEPIPSPPDYHAPQQTYTSTNHATISTKKTNPKKSSHPLPHIKKHQPIQIDQHQDQKPLTSSFYTSDTSNQHQHQPIHLQDVDYYQLPTIKKYDPTYPSLTFGIITDTFAFGIKDIALLNKNNHFDRTVFFQTFVDMPIHILKPAKDWGKVEFNFTGRINTVWGSSDIRDTSSNFIKVGKGVTETSHAHEVGRAIFWAKQIMFKVYSESEKQSFQIGMFPREVGLGLILGDNYRTGNPILTTVGKIFIDQYRPGVEFTTRFGKHDTGLHLYYSMYSNNSTSFQKKSEFTQAQQICGCGDGPPFTKGAPFRESFQVNNLIVAEMDFAIPVKDDNNVHVKPFLLYDNDRTNTVEFLGDAKSNLVTLGSTCYFKNDNLEVNFDIAGNLGHQLVKAWDRNLLYQRDCPTFTHLFMKNVNDPNCVSSDQLICNLNSSDGEFILASTFPYSANNTDESLKYHAGEIFQSEDPALAETTNCNPFFQNSYSRFRECYTNKYRGFMAATDIGYSFCENSKKLGFIAGYASGDSNPNDSTEKAYLHRMRDDWDQVRQDRSDHRYTGFQGKQSIYIGKHVQSVMMLRTHRLNDPINQVSEITANSFSNFTYAGLGLWHYKKYRQGTLRANLSMVVSSLTHNLNFGFDPLVKDVFETFDFQKDTATTQRFSAYNKKLSKFLGTEIVASIDFFGSNNVKINGLFSVFIPSAHYNDIKRISHENIGKNVPIKNQFQASALDISGLDNTQHHRMTLLNDTSIAAYISLAYNFDTTSIRKNNS